MEESPLALLDPPTRRRDLQIMLGCRKFSSIDMKAQPDQIREQAGKKLSVCLQNTKMPLTVIGTGSAVGAGGSGTECTNSAMPDH